MNNDPKHPRFLKNIPEVVALASHRQDGNMKAWGGIKAATNRRQFSLKHLHPGSKIVLADVCHGTDIRWVENACSPIVRGVDAIFTKRARIAPAVTFADCVGALFTSPNGSVRAAAHFSTANVSARFPVKVIREMFIAGINLNDIHATLGPHICPECYEYELSKLENLNLTTYWQCIKNSPVAGKCHVDLAGIIKYQLVHQAGIREENVDVSNMCTRCQNDRFFSARGEGMRPPLIRAGMILIGSKPV